MSDSEIPPHQYAPVVVALRTVFASLEQCGLDDVLSKGGVGSILLAYRLGHSLVPGDKGADAEDSHGSLFEYKVSTTNQFNFNFGGRPGKRSTEEVVRGHFDGLAGAYFGLRSGAEFTRVVFCPTASLVDHLVAFFQRSRSQTMVKNFSLQAFGKLGGARDV